MPYNPVKYFYFGMGLLHTLLFVFFRENHHQVSHVVVGVVLEFSKSFKNILIIIPPSPCKPTNKPLLTYVTKSIIDQCFVGCCLLLRKAAE